MRRKPNRRFWPTVCLAFAQAFLAHAIVPALTLRPAAGTPASAPAPALGGRKAQHGPMVRLAEDLSQNLPADAGRRGRHDRCRAFFASFKATPTKGPLGHPFGPAPTYGTSWSCVEAPRPPDAPLALPARRPPDRPAGLTLELCRPRC